MTIEQLRELHGLLRIYRNNLFDRGYCKLSNSLTEDIIDAVKDDIMSITRGDGLSYL